MLLGRGIAYVSPCYPICWYLESLRLGLRFREEVNKAYRKLAVLLHPDKCVAPGSEDAFKAVVNARTSLLKSIK